jgi:hypothetical protein
MGLETPKTRQKAGITVEMWSKDGARGRNRTGTTFLSRQILNLLCLPISPLGLAPAAKQC